MEPAPVIVGEDERLPDGHEGTMQERRGRRATLTCRMFFFGDQDFEGEATVQDVSTNGCRAASTIALTVGMPLKLSLFLPDSYNWPLRVEEAVVRWIDGEQFGLEFTEFRLAQRDRLRALMMRTRP